MNALDILVVLCKSQFVLDSAFLLDFLHISLTLELVDTEGPSCFG